MIKHLQRTTLIVLLFCLAMAANAQTVYITRTGAKYHRGECRYLHSSKIRTTLADAKLNYTACSVCKPPTEVEGEEEEEDGEVVEAGSSQAPAQKAPAAKPKPANTNAVVKARQCSGSTKSGARCRRTTTSPSGRCYQH